MGTELLVMGIAVLMLLAALVRGVAVRYELPGSVLLFVTGLLIALALDQFPGLLPGLSGFEISSDLVLFVFLPTLIFESASGFDIRSLGKNAGPIFLLAVPGLLVSTFLVAFLLSLLTAIDFPTGLLLGAILSATDPVAVLSVFQKLGAPRRLRVLVEGESLFNDAASLVLSRIIAGAVLGGALAWQDYLSGVGEFIYVFVGGAAVGALLGAGAVVLLRLFSTDSAITITVTTILAYLSFIVAEHYLHVSGVIATLAAGLVFTSRGAMKLPKEVRSYLEQFWQYVAFLANALLFLLMGLRIDLPTLLIRWDVLLILVGTMLVARSLVVFGLLPAYELLSKGRRIGRRYKGVLLWGGLRGAVPIAIVLSLPGSVATELLVSLVLGAVLLTLLLHGLTIEKLVSLLGLDEAPLSRRLLTAQAQLRSKEEGAERMGELTDQALFSPAIAREVEQEYQRERTRYQQRVEALEAESEAAGNTETVVMLEALSTERAFYHGLLDRGHLGEIAYRQLRRQNEAQADKVRYGGDVHDVRYGLLHPKTLEEGSRALLERIPGLAPVAERWRRRRLAIDYEVAWGHFEASERVLEYLSEIRSRELYPGEALEQVEEQYRHWNSAAREYLETTAAEFPEFVQATQGRLARRLSLLRELSSIEEQAEAGFLPHHVSEELSEDLSRRIWANRVEERAEIQTDPAGLLGEVPLFSGLSTGERKLLAEKLRPRTVNAGERVVRQGEAGRSLYLVARGAVRVIDDSSQESRQLATLMPGDFFGEMAILRESRRTASVEALSGAFLYELDRSAVSDILDEYPAIRSRVEEAERRRRG